MLDVRKLRLNFRVHRGVVSLHEFDMISDLIRCILRAHAGNLCARFGLFFVETGGISSVSPFQERIFYAS